MTPWKTTDSLAERFPERGKDSHAQSHGCSRPCAATADAQRIVEALVEQLSQRYASAQTRLVKHWSGSVLTFRIDRGAVSVSGTASVQQSTVTIEIALPLSLVFWKGRIRGPRTGEPAFARRLTLPPPYPIRERKKPMKRLIGVSVAIAFGIGRAFAWRAGRRLVQDGSSLGVHVAEGAADRLRHWAENERVRE